jgi:hypothetical protein
MADLGKKIDLHIGFSRLEGGRTKIKKPKYGLKQKHLKKKMDEINSSLFVPGVSGAEIEEEKVQT